MQEYEEVEAPLYQQVVEMEAIELHRLQTEVQSKGGQIVSLNTDCVSCTFPDDVLPFNKDPDSANLTGYYFDSEMQFPKFKLEEKETNKATVDIMMQEDYKVEGSVIDRLEGYRLFFAGSRPEEKKMGEGC